jgi:diguanylate cyclase (GGDEF)-like protein
VRLILPLLLLACMCAPLSSRASTASVEALLKQAQAIRSSDPPRFKRLLAELNGQAGQATLRQRQEMQYLQAYDLAYSGKYDEGSRLAQQVIAETSDVNLKFQAGTLVVNTYSLNGRFNEGLRQLGQTLALIDQVDDPNLRQQGLIVAATLYNQLGQYALGSHYADLVLNNRPLAGRVACFASYTKFDSLLHLGTLPDDDAPMESAALQCLSQGEVMMANLIRGTLAKKWIAQGQGDRALAMLQSHLEQINSTHYSRLIIEIRALMAEIQLGKDDLQAAERNAMIAINQSPSLVNSPPLVSAYATLYKVAEKRRDFSTALAFYKHYAAAEQGYLNEVKTRELAYQIVRNENQQKNQQIELLNRQNSLLQLQQRVDQQKAESSRQLMLLFAIFALVIAYWGYKTRRLHVSLRRMAQTDALTGICNRHHFTAQAEKTLLHCAKVGEQVSLIMFDLDHFKVINDTYGHVTGDWVLKEVAKTCSELCRRMDYFGRLGGEEFAILLQGCDAKAATRIAEDCRVRISRIASAPSGHAFKITASFGVSCAMSSGYDLDKLISNADQMLYRAKREGRNRVRAYTHDVPIETREPAPWHGPSPPVDPNLSASMGTAKA